MNDKTLFLNLWYKCNYNCVYCVIWWIQEEFNSEDFVSFEKIKEINLEWYNSVRFTWWEPTINPEFFEILDYFNIKWFNLFMQSNWSMLWTNDFFEKIKKYNINYQLPLNSFNEKIHNTIMKHKNAFNLTLSWIKNIINYWLASSLTVKLIMTKLNYNHLDKTILFLNNLWVYNFYIAYPVLKGNYLNYLNKLAPKYSDIKPFLNKLIEFEKEKNIKYVLESFPYCIIEKEQYKNVWEIWQLNKDKILNFSTNEIKEVLDISNNCFKKFWNRDDKRDCNTCKIIDLKERLNNVSFLHKNLDKEINANCLDNIHKIKNNSCLSCNYNLICSWISKEYVNLFWFWEFNNLVILDDLDQEKILNYINYIKNG